MSSPDEITSAIDQITDVISSQLRRLIPTSSAPSGTKSSGSSFDSLMRSIPGLTPVSICASYFSEYN